MNLIERYRVSHRYNKWFLVALEVALVLSMPLSIALCVTVPGEGPVERVIFCSLYLMIPVAIYAVVSAHSQFLVPRFARLDVVRADGWISFISPRTRWILLIGPWIVIMADFFALALARPEYIDRFGEGPWPARIGAGAILAVLLLFVRSRTTLDVRRGVVEGQSAWGPMVATFRTERVTAIQVGGKLGVTGDSHIDRRWFGGKPRRSNSFHPRIDLVVLNNAYAPLTVDELSAVAGVQVTVSGERK
ncbi:hypothetical protein [Gordonia aurantiaca]|uniref:hypothetical protein n=1 Tax=Gordonia sp. B21 TaxID=3151852 RepID=UPI003267E071